MTAFVELMVNFEPDFLLRAWTMRDTL